MITKRLLDVEFCEFKKKSLKKGGAVKLSNEGPVKKVKFHWDWI
jgi:hypothetical protein